ncbi:MAG: ATP-dependent DNA helicase RecQ [Bacteroidales bacterium]
MALTLHQILLKYWGYSTFRLMQEEIIRSVLEGKDTLALLPTGGGKSVCFQVPALAFDGLCIVVTPLIALMKDQVENLKRKGIKAVAIYSGMHPSEMEVAINNCLYSDVRFLYLSPERLETDMIRMNIEKMNIKLLAIDEAHCISQWGYDFRPSYLKILEIRRFLPNVPVLALTATATPDVVQDIQQKLAFRYSNVFQLSFERKNLIYVVQEEENKLNRLLKVTQNLKGSGIVYLRSRKKTQSISEFLNKNNVKANHYHAGLDRQTRDSVQRSWMSGETRVIVATNAFGMGIDKANVRFVVHLDVPDSLEAYFQEAGRAGRDGHNSYAVLLYEKADLMDAKSFLASRFPDHKTIRQIYHALGNFFNLAIGSGKDTTFDFDLTVFCNNYNFNFQSAVHVLSFLEKEGFISLQDLTDSAGKIFVKAGKADLYKFQVENAKFDKLIKTILRSYSGLFSEFVKINESDIAKRTGLQAQDIEKALAFMENNEILTYIRKKNNPQITFVTERIDSKDIYISDEFYKNRKKATEKRLQSVVDYALNNTKCRSRQLLAYFGEEISHRCGKCDVCVERNKIEMSELEFDTVVKYIKPTLSEKPCSIEELTSLAKGISKDKVIKVIQWLLDSDKIIYNEEKKIIWKK